MSVVRYVCRRLNRIEIRGGGFLVKFANVRFHADTRPAVVQLCADGQTAVSVGAPQGC